MQSSFWKERWEKNQIGGFHQRDTNPYLQRFYPELEVAPGARVLVPLCGKSRDMLWLNGQGHPVVGVELSQVAADSFFQENDLPVQTHDEPPLVRYRSGTIEILQGDFFDLTPNALGPVAFIYDRASLIAFPPEMRRRYAKHLAALVDSGARLLLITFEYPQDEMNGPPFSVPDREVHDLFDEMFDIRMVYEEDAFAENEQFKARGLSSLTERVYLATRR